jgi:hypothetical protein
MFLGGRERSAPNPPPRSLPAARTLCEALTSSATHAGDRCPVAPSPPTLYASPHLVSPDPETSLLWRCYAPRVRRSRLSSRSDKAPEKTQLVTALTLKKLASGAQPRSASDQQRCPGEEGQGDGGRDAECRLKGRIPHSEQSVAESIDEIEKRVEARYTFP